MKGTIKIFAAVLAIAASASCQKSNDTDIKKQNALIFSARLSNTDTKVTAHVSPDGSKLSTSWDEGDMIFIADDKWTDPNCPILNISKNAIPEENDYGARLLSDSTKLEIKYTPKAGATRLYAAFMGQMTKSYIANGKAEGVEPGFKQNPVYAEASYFAAAGDLSDPTIEFKPIFGLLEFTVEHPEMGVIDVEFYNDAVPDEFDFDFEEFKATVNMYNTNFLLGSDYEPLSPGTYYIPIEDGKSLSGFQFTIQTADGIILFTSSSSKTVGPFAAGKVISLGKLDDHQDD